MEALYEQENKKLSNSDILRLVIELSDSKEKSLVKRLFSLEKGDQTGKILRHILNHPCFTKYILWNKLEGVSEDSVNRTVRILVRHKVIESVDRIKLRGKGRTSKIFLLQGSDRKLISEAKILHVELQPEILPKPLYNFEIQQIAQDIVSAGIEKFGTTRTANHDLPEKWLIDQIEKAQGFFSKESWNAVYHEAKKRGWRVLIG